MPQSIHETLLGLLKMYCILGGMPAAVKAYVQGGEFAGQHLLYGGETYAEPNLHYWNDWTGR